MTIPTLVNNYQEKQTITKLRVAQNTFYNALRLAEVENGSIESWTNVSLTAEYSTKVADYLKKYMRIAKDCGIDDSQGKCIYNGRYKELNGTNHENYAKEDVYYAYKIVLINGASVFWHGGSYLTIFVDTNGPNEPNTWGRDLFSFRYENGKLTPSGMIDFKDSCETLDSTGYGCAHRVLSTNNMDYLKN